MFAELLCTLWFWMNSPSLQELWGFQFCKDWWSYKLNEDLWSRIHVGNSHKWSLIFLHFSSDGMMLIAWKQWLSGSLLKVFSSSVLPSQFHRWNGIDFQVISWLHMAIMVSMNHFGSYFSPFNALWSWFLGIWFSHIRSWRSMETCSTLHNCTSPMLCLYSWENFLFCQKFWRLI